MLSRRTPLKRVAFKRKGQVRHEPSCDREPQPMALPTVKSLHRGSYGPAPITAVPKTKAHRNAALLEMANGRPCLLCPGVCVCTPGSVVACHSNLGIHAKAKGRKADDFYSVWGGDFSHRWLDQSAATREVKEAAFMAAHARQVIEWRRIATDPSEPERFRKAALWALGHLNATPKGAE